MITLVVFLVGASSIVSSLAGRVRGSRTSAVRILLRVLVILTGCVLAARPLHVGAVGVLISACLPAAWIGSEVLERVGPGRSQATAVLHVARCGIGIGALALLCVMGPHGEEGRGALAVAWVGVLLFMTEPANQVVNAVLVLAGVPASEGVAPRKSERAGDSG